MSVQGRVWVGRLQNPDREIRLEAIRQLELIGGEDVLGPLARVYATDPDPEVRRLAQQAGKHIYYAAIRRAADAQEPSQEERNHAADILAKAQARRQQHRR